MKLTSAPESITHLHLLSVLATEIARKNSGGSRIRILDSGCGNGHLCCFLHTNLAALFPGVEIEISGYDVADHGVQENDYFSATLDWCARQCPDIRWEERLKLITHDQNWPFESGRFDYVVSNQVLEHVWDHQHYFAEHHRVLRDGGCGVHLFPLRHYIYEGHLLIPFVHRIADWFSLKAYIALMSKLGFGKYREHSNLSIDEFSEQHADYMTFYTNYLGYTELMEIVKRSRLRPSLAYTSDFYKHKLRQLFGREMIIDLGRIKRGGLTYWISNHFLKYVSSITLFAGEGESVRPAKRIWRIEILSAMNARILPASAVSG